MIFLNILLLYLLKIKVFLHTIYNYLKCKIFYFNTINIKTSNGIKNIIGYYYLGLFPENIKYTIETRINNFEKKYDKLIFDNIKIKSLKKKVIKYYSNIENQNNSNNYFLIDATIKSNLNTLNIYNILTDYEINKFNKLSDILYFNNIKYNNDDFINLEYEYTGTLIDDSNLNLNYKLSVILNKSTEELFYP